jgi:membrane-associated phospholipid phosphatase
MADRNVVLAIVGAFVVIALGLFVVTDLADPVDQAIIAAVRDPALDGPLGFLATITELGSTGAVTIVAGITLAVGALVGPWRHGALGAATIAAASVAVQVTKAGIRRERPDVLDPLVVEHGFSFPSGHATLSMVGYGTLAILVSRSRLPVAARILFMGLAGVVVFLVGLSRVWLGAHYPSDVVAGWTTGAVVVLVFATLTRAVSMEPAAVAVDADPAAPRSDPPAAA